ncbi:MAG: ATP synthase subunit I [Proteobacteria bacterium]|nr:ATP synthase subunit I [Pseudomonadota bacterium]
MNSNGLKETNKLFLKMFIISGIIFLIILVFAFSLKNILSFLAGALISFINIYWLQKIIFKLTTEGKVSAKNGISMGLKVLFVFGSITILILKAPINLLIFLFGLSILPVVIFLDSFAMIIKHLGGK